MGTTRWVCGGEREPGRGCRERAAGGDVGGALVGAADTGPSSELLMGIARVGK